MGSTGSDGAERGNVLSWHAETTEAEGAVARCHMARDGRVPGGGRACWRCVMHVEMTEAAVARRRVMCDGHASTWWAYETCVVVVVARCSPTSTVVRFVNGSVEDSARR